MPPIESAADFTSYLDTTTGHGVTATFFETGVLFDDFPLIDTLGFIDDGLSVFIKLIIDQEYFNIQGESVNVAGFQPRAIIKYSDAPNVSQNDKIVVDAITTDQGNVLKAQTEFRVRVVEPDNTGMVSLVLEEQ